MSDSPAPTEDRCRWLDILEKGDPTAAHEDAIHMIASGVQFLLHRFGAQHALARLAIATEFVRAMEPHGGQPAPVSVPTASPTACPAPLLAGAMLDHLRAMPEEEARERGRAVVAGVGAYLHETFGEFYASVTLDGALQAGAAHGSWMRGGRPSAASLH